MLRRELLQRQQVKSTPDQRHSPAAIGGDIMSFAFHRTRDPSHREETMPRALKNLDITLGLAVIPAQLFTATQRSRRRLPSASHEVRLPDPDAPRVSDRPARETVKGYEINTDEYVRFEPEELKAPEQAASSAVVIDSFVPAGGRPRPLRGHVLPRCRQEWRAWPSRARPNTPTDAPESRSARLPGAANDTDWHPAAPGGATPALIRLSPPALQQGMRQTFQGNSDA
jgi:hypothetical protein